MEVLLRRGLRGELLHRQRAARHPDGGDFYGSVYLYKDRNDPLLYMGPVWDFDISVGNASYAGVLDPTYQWTQTHSPWYAQLFADPSFKAATQQQWNNLKKNGVIANWLTSISNQAALLQQSQRNNFGRWPMQGIRVWPNPEASGSYDGEISYFQNWLALRIGYMDAFLNGQPAAKINISVPGGTLRSGTPVTLTARVTGDDPTGTVTFSYNSIVLGRADLDSTGTATLTTSSLPPGLWYIEAYYNGDSRNSVNGCLGPFVSVLRPLVQTAANLTASGTFTFGSPVTLTAAVVGVSGGSIPTGAFTFAANGISLGSAAVAANGVATLTTGTIPTGNVLITATYSGDVNFASSVSNSMSATEAQGTAKVSFANLNATYSGSPQSVTVATQPSGLSYTLTYNGSAAAPTAPGTYNVVATVTDPGYSGSASGTFTIAAAQSTISLSNLNATYNGSPQAVTVATQPKGLPYSISYNGLTTAPTVPGSYTVVATVTDPGYTGSTTGTLTIAKAAATVNLANLNATYSGHPQSASVTTQPEGLSYSLTYNGSSTAPTAAGSYNVVATIADPDYTGNAVATMTLAKAVPTLDWSAPAAITYGTPLSATQLSGAASIPGTITYSPPLGTLLGAGTQIVSATFSPADTNDYTNLTKSVQVVVTKQATSTTLSASATSVVPNQSLAFTATVAAAQNGTPTGTVSFSDGNSVLGTAALVNGTATYSTTSLISGTHALTASYNGDGNYAPSSLGTNLVSVEVAPLAFTLASNGPSSASLDGTSSTSLSYALTPTYGAYPGQVSFTVTGLPSTLQYTITPQTVAPDAGPVYAVLTITKKTSSTASASRASGNTAVWAMLLLAPYASARSRKRLRGRMLSVLLLTLGIGLLLGNTTGCGSQPAPEQMYHVAVTATTTAMQQTVMVDVSMR